MLVGGSEVAKRKARLLLAAGTDLQVGALHFSPAFRQWADGGELTLIPGAFDDA